VSILRLHAAAAPRSTTCRISAPHPCNPTTRIAYAIREAGPVSLRVCDTAGRLIRVLVGGRRSAGRHAAVWDGTNHGAHVASGVYYYRLVAGPFTHTKKMILLH
jgi:hypothetical protein